MSHQSLWRAQPRGDRSKMSHRQSPQAKSACLETDGKCSQGSETAAACLSSQICVCDHCRFSHYLIDQSLLEIWVPSLLFSLQRSTLNLPRQSQKKTVLRLFHSEVLCTHQPSEWAGFCAGSAILPHSA